MYFLDKVKVDPGPSRHVVYHACLHYICHEILRPHFLWRIKHRGVINGKTGKAAALPNFSDTLTLSQSEGADYAQLLALHHLKVTKI